jgi:hypothetical protein
VRTSRPDRVRVAFARPPSRPCRRSPARAFSTRRGAVLPTSPAARRRIDQRPSARSPLDRRRTLLDILRTHLSNDEAQGDQPEARIWSAGAGGTSAFDCSATASSISRRRPLLIES